MSINSYTENEKTYYVVYINGRDSRGQRIQRRKTKIETRRKAEHIEFEFKRELAKLKEEVVPFRWGEWFNECIQQMKIIHRPSTVIEYQRSLNKWINHRWKDQEISAITRNEVFVTIHEVVSSDLSAQTRRNILKMVRRIFEMAVEQGHLDRNPCNGLQVKVTEVEQKVLTNSEVEIFLQEAKITNHRFYPVWVLALMTGMRSGELFALLWTDVDFEAKNISVTKQWTNRNGICATKTGRSRMVPISEDLLFYLKELKLKEGLNRDTVLPLLKEWENGEQARITREFCKAIGITEVKFHDLRATFITNLLARGESLARVMAMVGHGQLRTTNGYLRRAGVEVQGGTEKLGYKIPKRVDGSLLRLLN